MNDGTMAPEATASVREDGAWLGGDAEGKVEAPSELMVVEGALSDAKVGAIAKQARALASRVHRNYVPFYKKGGSISAFVLEEFAPEILELYRSPKMVELVARIAGEPVVTCPPDDPHACALYYYTEKGDRVGWHYDSSFYRGRRYTVLLGVVEATKECRLLSRPRAPGGASGPPVATELRPGVLVVFDGDRLHHCVSPLEEGGERIVLTMEYVTDTRMAWLPRAISNLKDAVGYFGLSAVVRRTRRTKAQLRRWALVSLVACALLLLVAAFGRSAEAAEDARDRQPS